MLRTITKTLQKAWATMHSILVLKASFYSSWLFYFQGGLGFFCITIAKKTLAFHLKLLCAILKKVPKLFDCCR